MYACMSQSRRNKLAVKMAAPPTPSSVIIIIYRVIWWSFMMKKRASAVSVSPVSSHTATLDKWTHSCSPIGCEHRHHVPPVINSSRLLAPLVFLSLPSNFPAVYWVLRVTATRLHIEIKILWKLTSRVLQRVKSLLEGGSDPPCCLVGGCFWGAVFVKITPLVELRLSRARIPRCGADLWKCFTCQSDPYFPITV